MENARKTINELLVDIFNTILFIEERYMKSQGVKLSMTEIHILENVEKSQTKMLSDVARLQGVTAGTLSVAVNALVRKGYILKRKDAQDKRVLELVLTDSAEEVLKIHHRFHERLIDACIRDMQLEEESTMIFGLQKIVNYFKEELYHNALYDIKK